MRGRSSAIRPTVPTDEVVPGEARPLRAVLRVGDDEMGVLVGRLPATRTWERADQDLLELFASEVAVAIRNAQLFGQVEAQNAQLLELDAAKDDFLRGVSHNLQTPLTSIRAYAEQLEIDRPDQRLGIIAEQSRAAVADGPPAADRDPARVGRASPALRGGRPGHPGSQGLGGARRDRRAVHASTTEPRAGWRWPMPTSSTRSSGRCSTTPSSTAAGRRVASRSPWTSRPRACGSRSPTAGRASARTTAARLFGRFVRGAERSPDEGSGLGLYVSRELCRAMGGDLQLEPAAAGRGAAFSVHLPAESAEEG